MNTRIAPNRYSTIVAWVKIILPLVAIGVLSTLFLFAGRPDPQDALVVADIDVVGLADEQRLGQPRISGLLEDGRALRLTAERAAPLADSTDLFTAQDVSARLTLEPGLEAIITSADALMDMAAEVAELTGGVTIRRTDGVRMQTAEMMLGLSQLMAETGAVEISAPGLTLDAGAMVIGADALIHFNGGVRVLYDPSSVQEP